MPTTAMRPPPGPPPPPATVRPSSRGPAAALIVLAGLNLGAVAAVALHGTAFAGAGTAGLFTWAGRVAGLLAEVLLVGQFLLAARIPWLERSVGQDVLLRWHRPLGQILLVAVCAHPLLLAAGYGGARLSGFLPQAYTLATTYLSATAGAVVIVVVAALSVAAARRRLRYEIWYAIHLATYAAVVLAFGHQLSAGRDLAGSPVITLWWKGQLVITAACLVMFRLGLPLVRSARHQLRVSAVVPESPDVVSIYLCGRRLDRLPAVGSQFFQWRFLSRDGWWEAHPYSLSASPTPQQLRITVGLVGDGTERLTRLAPGTRVLVEGPYGTFTADTLTTPKVLLIGAGLGITPVRALLEELPRRVDVTLLHRVGAPDEAVLVDELSSPIRSRRGRAHLITGPRGSSDDPQRPMGPAHLRRLVPDITRREVYLCGPPGFCTATTASLRQLGVPAARIHQEAFAL